MSGLQSKQTGSAVSEETLVFVVTSEESHLQPSNTEMLNPHSRTMTQIPNRSRHFVSATYQRRAKTEQTTVSKRSPTSLKPSERVKRSPRSFPESCRPPLTPGALFKDESYECFHAITTAPWPRHQGSIAPEPFFFNCEVQKNRGGFFSLWPPKKERFHPKNRQNAKPAGAKGNWFQGCRKEPKKTYQSDPSGLRLHMQHHET